MDEPNWTDALDSIVSTAGEVFSNYQLAQSGITVLPGGGYAVQPQAYGTQFVANPNLQAVSNTGSLLLLGGFALIAVFAFTRMK